jgi:poly-gamma-glutamate synthesis protein (capsule biosynthesis protein)
MAKLFICGDLLNNVTTQNFFSSNIMEEIKKTDYSIVNFEAPIENNFEPIKKAGPHKKQKKETISILKEVGFDLLLLANNHIFDYGKEGLKSTLDECHKNSIKTIGAELSFEKAYEPLIVNIKGFKFGFINASEAQFGALTTNESESGYAWINHKRINETVIHLKEVESVDYIIFFAHAGLEHYDIPLIEWRNRYKELCDLGADCVIGSHPHVPQGYEKYGEKMIFYSLGNFYFPKKDNQDKVEHGYSLILDFQKDSSISFEMVYHTVNNNVISRIASKDSIIDFKSLNSKLEEDKYNKVVDLVYSDAYEKICYPYYASTFNAVIAGDKIQKKVKNLIKQLLFPKINQESREILLYHLTRNETYRYITEKAIKRKFDF